MQNANAINATISILLVCVGCVGVFVWNSPQAATKLSTILKARARALEAARNTYEKVYQLVMREVQ